MAALGKFWAGKFWAATILGSAMLLTAIPAKADVKAGVEAWDRGDYPKAVAEWRPAAVAGDPVAQFNMGQAYKLGRGVEMDHAQAIAWYKSAADQGHVEAFDNYGMMLFNMNRRAEAMPYIETSAARGEARAQYVMGTAYFNGDLAPKDWPRAYALMTRASSKGLAQASARLADLDKFIPMEQRQQGIALAAQIEREESQARLAALPVVGHSKPSASSTTSAKAQPLPKSTASAGTSYVPPALDGSPVKTSPPAVKAPPKTPVKTAAAKPIPPKPAPQKPAPAKETAKAAPKPAQSGPWTTQIGAFSSQSNAASMWSRIGSKAPFSGYNARYVPAGSVVRVQVGAFPSREAAVKFCAAAKSSAPGCFPIKR